MGILIERMCGVEERCEMVEETTIAIKGMTSYQCHSTIRSALLDLAGVFAVEIYLDEEKGVITYDENKVSINELTSLIQRKGYDVE
ncbi:heavy-metal-associated domain-containing protein [Guptibacillus algicola]|uniref:heavy-metal-associated domain-containing protein n=1 Tax=Guptibacillus algicola TaxID=225844 RepID=UPI001CD4C6D6|nr:cation transporter [Alkalihalobacillus algicola]MCA0985933.1 cation transporter [Alkalihalobacillus algicola]